MILAYMTPQERKKILGDISVDEKILQEIKENGYAKSNGEREEGLFGIVIPIFGERGRLVAAVSLSGPTVRFENGGFEEKKQAIIRMGENISGELAGK